MNNLWPNIILKLRELKIEINSFEKINHGNNSEVFFIKTKHQDLILKVYPNKEKDKRDRIGVELNFINLLEKAKYFNKPKIITYDITKNYAIFSKLPGDSLRNYDLNNWLKLCDFAIEVNHIGNKHKNEWNKKASEAYFIVGDHFNNIEKRLATLSNHYKKVGIEKIYKYITKILIPRFKKIYIKEFNNNNISKKLDSITLSVSDIGFHNCNSYKNKLLFYDFEYAGWDFTGKLATDIIINPRYKLDIEDVSKIISKLQNELNCSEWISEMRWTIPLYAIKWCILSLQFKGGFKKKKILKIENWIIETNNYLNWSTEIMENMNLS